MRERSAPVNLGVRRYHVAKKVVDVPGNVSEAEAPQSKQATRRTYEEMFAASGLCVFRRALDETRRRGQFHLSQAHLLDALAVEDAASFGALVERTGLSVSQVREYVSEAVASYPPQAWRGVRTAPEAVNYLRRVKEVARSDGRRIEIVDFFAVLAEGELRFPRRAEWCVKAA